MDNENKPDYLKKILKKQDGISANENPALNKEKVLAPLKDGSTTLPEEKRKTHKIDEIREKGKGVGRGIRGGETTSPNQAEAEYKTPTQKIMEKGSQKPGGGGRGGAPITKDPGEIIREKQKMDKPNDVLSKNEGSNQQKQKHQEQQAQYKPAEQMKALSPRERANMAKEAKENQAGGDGKKIELAKDSKQVSIRERIAKATEEKNNAPAKTGAVKENNLEVAMNKVKTTLPKPIKR